MASGDVTHHCDANNRRCLIKAGNELQSVRGFLADGLIEACQGDSVEREVWMRMEGKSGIGCSWSNSSQVRHRPHDKNGDVMDKEGKKY